MHTLYAELWLHARALVVLKIIFDLGPPVPLWRLVAATGGNHETVAKYCSILSTMGLIARVSSHTGWTPTAQGFAFMRVQNPLKLADSDPLITTTTTTIDSNRVVVDSLKSGNSAFFSENLDLFDEIGIMLTDQTRFIAEHVQPEIIRAEWKKLTDKGKPWPGLLIKILTTSKPKTREQQDIERRQRYAEYNQRRQS